MEARRAAVSRAEAHTAAAEVARRVLALDAVAAAPRVALYASVGDELPTGPLLEALRAAGCTPLFPRCVGRTLEFAAAERFEDLALGRYGVPEPSGPAVALGTADAVVVPGLAFDGAGRRVGRGGGYYDRAFPPGAAAPFLVGVGFDVQRVAEVPAGPADRRMDAVVTERGTFRAGAEAVDEGDGEARAR